LWHKPLTRHCNSASGLSLKLNKEEGQMHRNLSFLTERLLLLVMGIILFAPLAACRREKDIDITAKTAISGIVNGSPLEVNVVATFNTGRGGSSTCTFTKLPTGFNPASLGTHT